MVQQDDSPSTLGAYGVRLRVQQRPPQYAARGRTVLAHRRGYSGRRLLTQVSPVALVFTTPALHALGLSAEPYQVSSVIQWQVFHTPILLACKQSSTTTSPRWWCASTA